MNEGIDIPNLKIAVLHSSYKSLSILLQFIGRFARVGSDHIGSAKFIASPDDTKIEAIELIFIGTDSQSKYLSRFPNKKRKFNKNKRTKVSTTFKQFSRRKRN